MKGRLFLTMVIFLAAACGALPGNTAAPSPSLHPSRTGEASAITASPSPTSTQQVLKPNTETPLPSRTGEAPAITASPSPSSTQQVLRPNTETPLPSRTGEAPAATASLSPSATRQVLRPNTATPIPTYTTLRGKILEQANCRYGPGAMYLYKYGVYPGYVMDIIGRTEVGDWVVVQAIGGTNPCWVKASLIDIRGDVMTVAPTYLELPRSPYYYPPTGVEATRDGSTVTVSWYAIKLRAGDDSLQTPYVVEAWVCIDGKIVFIPVGSWGTQAKVTDEPGCSEASHAQLLAAEKHGYTAPVEIPWP